MFELHGELGVEFLVELVEFGESFGTVGLVFVDGLGKVTGGVFGEVYC